MPKVKHIGIEGFKRLSNVDVEMRPLMVMVGANGVGKTSFMDAISLLAASARGSLNQTLSGMGGAAEVLTRGSIGDIALRSSMDVPDHQPLEYSLSLSPQGQGYAISEEMLTQARAGYTGPFKHIESVSGDHHYYDPDSNNLVRPNWEHDSLESCLSQVPKMFQQPEELRRTLSSATQYHVLDVGKRSPVKLPQQLRPAALPGENGEDLAPFLYNLRESDGDRYEVIEDSLKAAFPGFEALSFPIVAAGMISMTWKDKAFKHPFYSNQLSEGTLRFLWLASLLQSRHLPTITMIDEPEVSLHPESLALLADLMREASMRTQIVVATHSDRLIRFLKPEEVAVMDLGEDGSASITWADSLDLEHWLHEYSLDQVWQMGEMGGRA